MNHHTTRLALAGIVVLVIILIIFSIIHFFTPSTQVSEITPTRIPPPTPILTSSRTIRAQAHTPVAAFVSYTDQGFEPSTLSVHPGDRIRITNNSTKPLVLSADISTWADGTPLSTPLVPGEYGEVVGETSSYVFKSDNNATLILKIE